jgi:hypothetical protein
MIEIGQGKARVNCFCALHHEQVRAMRNAILRRHRAATLSDLATLFVNQLVFLLILQISAGQFRRFYPTSLSEIVHEWERIGCQVARCSSGLRQTPSVSWPWRWGSG